jgi:hypothetical protein
MFDFLFNTMYGLVSGLCWLAATAFWIWMIVECVTKETGNDRTVWIIVIVFVPWVGAILYYLVRRPERIRAYGGWERQQIRRDG